MINSEGSDEISITGASIPLDVLSKITGKEIDATSGVYIDGPAVPPYMAIGYQYELTSGDTVVYWRLKGKFTIPDVSSATQDDGTDSSGQELTYTGVNTNHVFTKTGKTAKGIVADSRFSTFDAATVLATVHTPDVLTGITAKV